MTSPEPGSPRPLLVTALVPFVVVYDAIRVLLGGVGRVFAVVLRPVEALGRGVGLLLGRIGRVLGIPVAWAARGLGRVGVVLLVPVRMLGGLGVLVASTFLGVLRLVGRALLVPVAALARALAFVAGGVETVLRAVGLAALVPLGAARRLMLLGMRAMVGLVRNPVRWLARGVSLMLSALGAGLRAVGAAVVMVVVRPLRWLLGLLAPAWHAASRLVARFWRWLLSPFAWCGRQLRSGWRHTVGAACRVLSPVTRAVASARSSVRARVREARDSLRRR